MKMFVLGMIAWQLVVFLVGIISHEDEEKIVIAGYGIFFLLTRIIGKIATLFIVLYHRKKYHRYRFYGQNGEAVGSVFMDKETAKYFRIIPESNPNFAFTVKPVDYKITEPIWGSYILSKKDFTTGKCGFSADYLAKFMREVE